MSASPCKRNSRASSACRRTSSTSPPSSRWRRAAAARTSSTSAWAIPTARRRSTSSTSWSRRVQRPDTHGYSVSKGIPRLRRAICHWYERRWGVEFDPETEAIVTIGSKEGIAHLALATLGRGDTVLVPNPSYPIHIYGPVIAGADIRHVPMTPDVDFFAELERTIHTQLPQAEDADHQLPVEPDGAVRRAAVLREDRRAGEGVRHLGRPRPRLRRHLLRRLEGAVDHAGAGRARRRRRVLHDVEELQHGGLADRLHGRQPATSSTRSRGSRATTTTARSRRSRSRRSPRSRGRRTASRRSR